MEVQLSAVTAGVNTSQNKVNKYKKYLNIVHSVNGVPTRGALIVLEGLDRSGKSTQIKLLYDALKSRGVAVDIMSALNRESTTGKVIDKCLRRQKVLPPADLHLLFSANRREQHDTVLQKLANGVTVLMDRYCYSGLAYAVADSVDASTLTVLINNDLCLAEPDLLVFLDVDPDTAATRHGFGEEINETKEKQEVVRKEFKSLIRPHWKVIKTFF